MDDYNHADEIRDFKSMSDYQTYVSNFEADELKKRIKSFKGRFKPDFTEEYLDKLSVEKLRHILFAALVTNRSRK